MSTTSDQEPWAHFTVKGNDQKQELKCNFNRCNQTNPRCLKQCNATTLNKHLSEVHDICCFRVNETSTITYDDDVPREIILQLARGLNNYRTAYYCPFPGCVCTFDPTKMRIYPTRKELNRHCDSQHGLTPEQVKQATIDKAYADFESIQSLKNQLENLL